MALIRRRYLYTNYHFLPKPPKIHALFQPKGQGPSVLLMFYQEDAPEVPSELVSFSENFKYIVIQIPTNYLNLVVEINNIYASDFSL